jgi:hypothetical protein
MICAHCRAHYDPADDSGHGCPADQPDALNHMTRDGRSSGRRLSVPSPPEPFGASPYQVLPGASQPYRTSHPQPSSSSGVLRQQVSLASSLLEKLLSNSPGIAIGENHHSRASIKFLIDNAVLLKSLGITHLLTEKYRASSNHLIDHFYKVGKSHLEDIFSPDGDCAAAVATLEKAQHYPPELKEKYSILNLFETMKRHGIRIIGIDTEFPNAERCAVPGEKGQKARSERARHFIHNSLPDIQNVIRKEIQEGKKYILLTGLVHAGDFFDYNAERIEGIASRLRIPSLGIIESSFEKMVFLST